MNFEESYERFLNGTASDDEVNFVAEEIRKAKEIERILNLPAESPVFEAASDETVIRARKSFNRKNLIRTLVVIICSLAFLAALVCGILFIPSTLSARQSRKFTRDECTQIAIECAAQYFGNSDESKFVVHDVDRHLSMRHGLTKAVYMYEVELINDTHEIEIYVNSSSGYAEVTDVSLNR